MASIKVETQPEIEDILLYLTRTEAIAVAAVLNTVSDFGKTYGPAADNVWQALESAGFCHDDVEYNPASRKFKDDV